MLMNYYLISFRKGDPKALYTLKWGFRQKTYHLFMAKRFVSVLFLALSALVVPTTSVVKHFGA